MKSIDLRHRLAAVLLAMCLVVCCALPAFATSANIVLGRLGSLHVRLYDTHNDVPLRGGELTLYQVASVKRTNGNLYFDYTGDFTGCGVVLGDLVGYERQKKQLTDNTEAFLNEQPANNVLLYGDAGTGKSTSIKALLNHYYDRGLRMIEVYKHDFKYLPEIISIIKLSLIHI